LFIRLFSMLQLMALTCYRNRVIIKLMYCVLIQQLMLSNPVWYTQSCRIWILFDSGNLYLLQIRLSGVYQALFVSVVLLTSPSLLWHCWLHNTWWTWSKYPPKFLFWGHSLTWSISRRDSWLRQTECVHFSALVMCSCVSAAKKAREQLNVVSIKLLNIIGEMQ